MSSPVKTDPSKTKNPARDRLVYSYLASFLILVSVAFRSILEFFDTPFRWWVIGLMILYMLLFATEWFITRKLPFYRSLYFNLQCWIALILLLHVPPFDYFAVLFVPLLVQAFWLLPRKAAYLLTGVFVLLASGSLVDSFGWQEGIGYALTYTAVYSFVVIVCIMTLQAEQAQEKSQALLAELRETHTKLQAYAEQVEDLAAIQERSRLARELHDSVTQTIFSLTLTAQAAQILLEKDPARVKGQLDHLQTLAKSALTEMRTLIQQRPRSVAEDGLEAALRRYVAERQAQDGLLVDLSIRGSRNLPQNIEEALFRVIREALNNVVKHAQTDRASVALLLDQNPVQVLIDDEGTGFDPPRLQTGETRPGETTHFGLASMAERVEALGGRLVVDSKPGSGTHIRVENIRVEEAAHE